MVLNAGELAKGMSLAYEAAQFAAKHKRVQKKFVSVLKFTMLFMAIAYALIYGLVFFPLFLLRGGNRILSTLLQYDHTQSALALLSTRDAVDHFLGTLPLLGLDLIVHVKAGMFEDIFFTMLEEIDPEYARALKTWPPRKFRWAKIKFAAKRLAKRYFMTLVASYLSQLPLVGWLVVPVGALTMMGKFVGYPVSAGIILATVVSPGSRRSTMFIFKSLLAMGDFSRDLMRPYFSHLGAKPKQQVAFYRANESMVIGFILAYYFFVQLSWVGPAFYILAQAAIAMFISRQTARPPNYTPGATWELVAESSEAKKTEGAGGSPGDAVAAPKPHIEQTTSRSATLTADYSFDSPIFLRTKGIRTTNVRICKAQDTRWGDMVHLEAKITSMSTTIHGRIHANSHTDNQGECVMDIQVDWSIWDMGMTNAEISIILPITAPLDEGGRAHPGIRVDIPTGAIGVTMMGSTHFRYLDLSTAHGPAHLSDIAADAIKLVAHNGNITIHDIESCGPVEVVGKAAWMDIDDVRAASLAVSSTDAIVSLKDIQADTVSATTTNARIGLGNVKAGALELSTCNGEVVGSGVYAGATNVKVTKGDIEGSWYPKKKLYLGTSDAKIAVQVHVGTDDGVEVVAATTNGPIQLDLPATFTGGFSLETSGFFKTFIHAQDSIENKPELSVSKPDHKVGAIGSGPKRHSLRAMTKEAPVTVNFGTS
ncbi:hypothetical protein GGI07_001844 [Coemansia sp. Benny D115]|nr:hypothetical protein GGI07_001844 [Coemansia sp. Benny D115]